MLKKKKNSGENPRMPRQKQTSEAILVLPVPGTMWDWALTALA